jgi:hypothetical protein
MKLIVRISIIFCIMLAGLGGLRMAYRWVDGLFRAQMVAYYQFKRAHVSGGKILSVSMVQPNQQATNRSDDSRRYKICFSIDSFSDIPQDLQSEYETAERSRERTEGQPCGITRQTQLPAYIKPGEDIEVVYLLYGRGIITFERLVVDGQEVGFE